MFHLHAYIKSHKRFSICFTYMFIQWKWEPSSGKVQGQDGGSTYNTRSNFFSKHTPRTHAHARACIQITNTHASTHARTHVHTYCLQVPWTSRWACARWSSPPCATTPCSSTTGGVTAPLSPRKPARSGSCTCRCVTQIARLWQELALRSSGNCKDNTVQVVEACMLGVGGWRPQAAAAADDDDNAL